jgi:hypothetical protein
MNNYVDLFDEFIALESSVVEHYKGHISVEFHTLKAIETFALYRDLVFNGAPVDDAFIASLAKDLKNYRVNAPPSRSCLH